MEDKLINFEKNEEEVYGEQHSSLCWNGFVIHLQHNVLLCESPSESGGP